MNSIDSYNKRRYDFASIAEKYDFLNTLFSFGIDKGWREQAIRNLDLRSGGRYLDFCAGTLPLSALILKKVRITLKVVSYDFCKEMLIKGKLRCLKYLENNQMEIIVGNGEKISFKPNTYDGSIVCFGIRNLVKIEEGLKELMRVLKPGAKLVILEFSNQINPFLKPFYFFYLEKIMPRVGGMISGNKEAYQYLANSIRSFLKPEELKGKLLKAGFKQVYYIPLTFGIAYIYVGTKE